jgi:hypothetical protein
MKKKSSRDIPDFSRHSTRPKAAGAPEPSSLPVSKVVSARPPRPKPKATASRSGQRGK